MFAARIGRTGNSLAGTGLVTRDLGRTSGHATRDRLAACRFGNTHFPVLRLGLAGAKTGELLFADIVIAGDVAAAACLIAGHALTTTNHGPGDRATTQGLALADLGRSSADILRRRVLGTGQLAVHAGLVARDLLGTANLVSGDTLAFHGFGH